MATAAEARAFVKQNFNVDEMDGGMLKMLWDLEDGRSQLVFVNVSEELMMVVSPIAKVGSISADKVFDANDNFWGIVKFGELYCLSHVILLANADANEIAQPLEMLAVLADKMENSLGLGDVF